MNDDQNDDNQVNNQSDLKNEDKKDSLIEQSDEQNTVPTDIDQAMGDMVGENDDSGPRELNSDQDLKSNKD